MRTATVLPLVALFVALRFCGAESAREFHVWAASCAHVPADIQRGRESLALAIGQSEGRIDGAPAFDWDIMLDAGDLSAHQYPPDDRDGIELIRQYQTLTRHRREQIYNVPGNHDAPYYDHGPGSWIRKWGDPFGENTEFSGVDAKRRPFPVTGNWERYRFAAGNLLFLMLADRNDAPEPVGRGHSRDGRRGGYPAGAVTRDTFNWWKQQVLANQDKLIITMHHHMLRDTTTASGKGEGNPRYHGASGGPEGSSYLYYLIEDEDPEHFKYLADAHVFEDFLEAFHRQHGRGAIDLWIGGHTHVKNPDDNWGGKTISERRWGVGFLQVAALTKHHGGSIPLSRLLTFTDGGDRLRAAVYVHASSSEEYAVGFHNPTRIEWPLRHPFKAPAPIGKLPPFPASARKYTESYRAKTTPSRRAGPGLIKAEPSIDLSAHWDAATGRIPLESLVQSDTAHQIGNKPTVAGTDKALYFDGRQRVRIGPLDLAGWSNLTVSAWIKTKTTRPQMRIVSKDDLGTPGNFVLLHGGAGTWTFRVWDNQARRFKSADFHSDDLADDQWHHLVGTVDSAARKVILHVDGVPAATAPWTAQTLDDSDQTDLTVGSDSGRDQFGHTFEGLIRDVRVLPRIAPELQRIGTTKDTKNTNGR